MKKKKMITVIAILLVTILITAYITVALTLDKIKNSELSSNGYKASPENTNSNLIASYIKKGVKIGGIIGTFDALDTSDATATPEDIALGKTAYVKGQKITGTREEGGGDTEGTPESVADAIKKGTFFDDKNTPIKDDLDNVVIIPKGFKVASDSATKVEDGVVVEDHVGNQFVWIPAKTGAGTVVHTQAKGDVTMVYKRTDFGKNDGSYSNYSEAMPSDEEASVNANGGYYIGRYEAGDKESTDAKTMRSSGTSTANTVTIQKGQAPYNWATYDEQKSLAEGMKNQEQQKYEATTKLSSSYAWDTAISFMQIKNEDYGTSSVEGNYKETTFEFTDISGEKVIKKERYALLIPTGQTTPVCNIYDMGGNCYERTTERYSSSSYPVSYRGGFYGNSYAGNPAGNRGYGNGNAYDNRTFRVTLYL